MIERQCHCSSMWNKMATGVSVTLDQGLLINPVDSTKSNKSEQIAIDREVGCSALHLTVRVNLLETSLTGLTFPYVLVAHDTTRSIRWGKR